MRLNDKYYKKWKIKQDIKKFERNVIKKQNRKIRRKEKLNVKKEEQNLNFAKDIREEIFEVPENFSIINNPNETIDFLTEYIKKLMEKLKKQSSF